ncbi:hypothetical protein ANCCEY_10099 [Ancylostoma ceylanicum]|uniref:Uncharacterized protein n=1 Tax=Ancylostoma ceylanicum TaxID=53326 RepID=A0A0D6LFG6_9BILA|nr:hypothetical protein ANCCEY_10099 [Ancylostoma ceylanicum]
MNNPSVSGAAEVEARFATPSKRTGTSRVSRSVVPHKASYICRRSQRVVLPYVTHYSDSGFGSALSSGSSCSYLPPPPPYRMRSKNHKILRSFSDSKYSVGQQSAIAAFMAAQRTKHGAGWNSQCSLVSF